MFWQIPKFLIHFNDGAVVEQLDGRGEFTVHFINDKPEFHSTTRKNHWAKTDKKYYIPWEIHICDKKGDLVLSHQFDSRGKKIRINIDSRALGDTLAWIPQIDKFAKLHPNADVYVSQFLTGLGFEDEYPNLQFINPEELIDDIYATYNIGYYFDELAHYHPTDPRSITLGKVAADVLGIGYEEIRPRISVDSIQRIITQPYVCIATQSTAGCKLWQHEQGWQRVVDYLHKKGLQTVVIQQEENTLDNVIDKSGDAPLQERMTDIMHCEFFIGLGSGLSWLSWALCKPVILISGFSLPYAEFSQSCTRILNTNVCHGCWNSCEFTFDRGDWEWCPRHKGTDRQFECTHAIVPDTVFKAIDSVLLQTKV